MATNEYGWPVDKHGWFRGRWWLAWANDKGGIGSPEYELKMDSSLAICRYTANGQISLISPSHWSTINLFLQYGGPDVEPEDDPDNVQDRMKKDIPDVFVDKRVKGLKVDQGIPKPPVPPGG